MSTYLVISKIQIQQIPTEAYPNRNRVFVFKYLNKYEGESSWANLTQTLKITLPKRVQLFAYAWDGTPFGYDPNSNPQPVQLGNVVGNDSNLGGLDSEPVFLRGDLIRFDVGYSAIISDGNNGREQTYMTGENGLPHMFEGLLSSVQPKYPFTLECEDWTWLLKQMPTPAKQWGSMTLGEIVTSIIADSQDLPIIARYKGFINLSVSDFSTTDLKFNVNNFITIRGNLGELLARIKSQYRVDSYFRGQQLRIGLLHYQPDDVTKPYPVFTFQKNILDNDKLQWRRRDDTVMSMIVKSNYLTEKTGTTLDGHATTKHASTEVLVYSNFDGHFEKVVKEKGKDFPTKYLHEIGTRFTFNIYDAITDTDKLFAIGKAQLEKYYYNGFKGSFTTFGIPYIKHGDTIQIVDNALPERTGLYKVKSVSYYGGYEDGLRQEITIDYKVSE